MKAHIARAWGLSPIEERMLLAFIENEIVTRDALMNDFIGTNNRNNCDVFLSNLRTKIARHSVVIERLRPDGPRGHNGSHGWRLTPDSRTMLEQHAQTQTVYAPPALAIPSAPAGPTPPARVAMKTRTEPLKRKAA